MYCASTSPQPQKYLIEQKRIAFKSKMRSIYNDIENTFDKFHREIDRKEEELKEIVQKIEVDTLEKFDKVFSDLVSICKIKDSIIASISEDTDGKYYDTQLAKLDSDMSEKITDCGIEIIPKLKWRRQCLDIENVVFFVKSSITYLSTLRF